VIAMSRLNSFLQGLHVVDVSACLPGPMAGLLLACTGAEVPKIESPLGDGTQRLEPRDAAGKPLFDATLNVGKTVCRIDLKNLDGRQDFLRHADAPRINVTPVLDLAEALRSAHHRARGVVRDTAGWRLAGVVSCLDRWSAAGRATRFRAHRHNSEGVTRCRIKSNLA